MAIAKKKLTKREKDTLLGILGKERQTAIDHVSSTQLPEAVKDAWHNYIQGLMDLFVKTSELETED